MLTMPRLTTYEQAESWLLSVTDYERLLGRNPIAYNTRTFDLEHFRQQLRALGDPQKRYAVVHVAGTKGKGSTCAFMEAALRRCGFRTGLYTSPHLYRFTERIRVDGADINDSDFCRLINSIGSKILPEATDREVNGQERSFRTVFEILTAAAFQYFAEQNVDIAIIETGLGGRLDSTNVFDEPGAGPLINVITAIGLDHISILGDTVAAIAGEKAGILRPHAYSVLAAQATHKYEETVRDVVEARQAEIGAQQRLFAVTDEVEVTGPLDGAGRFCFRARSGRGDGPLARALDAGLDILPSLEGAHQRSNAATALVALRELEVALAATLAPLSPSGGPWPTLIPGLVKDGIEATLWPGRFSVVDARVPVVIDGAHCAISTAALGDACAARFGDAPAVIITGFLQDKSGVEMLQAVADRIPIVKAIGIPPPSPRAQSSDHIVAAMEEVFGSERVQSAASLEHALTEAIAAAANVRGYVVVFGSLYLVGPALDFF